MDANVAFYDFIDQFLAVQQVDQPLSGIHSFQLCRFRERTCCDEKSFLNVIVEGSPKVTDISGPYHTGIPFTLKCDIETKKTVDTKFPGAVELSVSGLFCNFDLREPTFAQDALGEPFKSVGSIV